jgi:hypothetical protein
MDEHTLEGLRVRCNNFFSVVKNGRCMECGRRVKVITEDVGVAQGDERLPEEQDAVSSNLTPDKTNRGK